MSFRLKIEKVDFFWIKVDNKKMKLPRFNLNKILLYYSAVFTTVLIIGGFYAARSRNEIISNLLFLPVVIFLWITAVRQFRAVKKIKKLKVADLNKK